MAIKMEFLFNRDCEDYKMYEASEEELKWLEDVLDSCGITIRRSTSHNSIHIMEDAKNALIYSIKEGEDYTFLYVCIRYLMLCGALDGTADEWKRASLEIYEEFYHHNYIKPSYHC